MLRRCYRIRSVGLSLESRTSGERLDVGGCEHVLGNHDGRAADACRLSWEDAGMDRLHGAAQAVGFVRSLLWEAPTASFDAAFSNQGTDG